MSDVYTIAYSDLFIRSIKRVGKKDKELCEMIKRKVREIATNPNPTRYGSLKYELTGLNHVHVGHFVLFFSVNKETKTVTLVDFKHHN